LLGFLKANALRPTVYRGNIGGILLERHSQDHGLFIKQITLYRAADMLYQFLFAKLDHSGKSEHVAKKGDSSLSDTRTASVSLRISRNG
jgi:hypothetical protein